MNTDIDFPAHLPAPSIGYKLNPVSPQKRIDMQAGRPIVYARFTDVPVNLNLNWHFTDAQAVAFENFYWDTLLADTRWFNLKLRLPQGYKNYVCAFVGIYNNSRLDHSSLTGVWLYNASLEIYTRPK